MIEILDSLKVAFLNVCFIQLAILLAIFRALWEFSFHPCKQIRRFMNMPLESKVFACLRARQMKHLPDRRAVPSCDKSDGFSRKSVARPVAWRRNF